ncbi:MAG TPA: thermonuclease family protein [Candidatus Saccharimonadales bacterium]|nr:thermonuclease family protein [Candidatus Saccharimonadales bacterium]
MRSLRYWRRHKLKFVLLLIILFLVVATQSGWLANAPRVAEQNQPGLYTINHYVDGDTIAVNMNGNVETVRFIGVDTPETHKPNTPVQCYGPQAAGYTKQRVGQFGKVRLSADPLDTNRDVYGRLLRYVYLPDGTLLDQELIQKGYGFAYLDFPFSKKAQFAKAESAARSAKVGLWAVCHPTINKYGGYTSNPAG